MVLSRAVRAAIALTSIAVGSSALAGTPALVIDAASGRVLFSDRATDPWYPASITKLMTTYVALDMVRTGRASLNQLLTLSPEAAAQPPSKMGFKPGTQLTLDNALKIIMVKSANDIATMIGENLGGSVDGFAEMMNEAARRLGMHESRWYNPSGLPHAGQQTSARDMAILARALIRDFPERADLFQIGAVQLGKKVMRNHNGLLGRYPGTDGMKTGFICSGGFNVVASATQNGRRIITVVMGYPTARERDLRAADLFDQGFNSSGGWGAQRVEDLPPSSIMSPPDMRPFVCGGQKRQPQEDDETAVVHAGAAENGISALFSPSTFATPSGNTPLPGGRRTLGPRVAFTPIPVWIGAQPGAVPEEGANGKVRLATKPVRTQTMSRTASGGQLPSTAQAYTSANSLAKTPPISDEKSDRVENIRATPTPSGRATLRANLDAKPAADIKPKSGATGGAGERRPNLGGITPKPIAITAERETGSSALGGTNKPAAKTAATSAAAKPSGTKPHGSTATKPAAAGKAAKPAAKAAASTPAKKTDKPKRASAAE
jgi:D-alanyl-D-alanine carboxypeptidase